MYVCNLDRPWEQTPFPVHGFYIRDLDEVRRLKVNCNHIFIDTKKGIAPSSPQESEQVDGSKRPFLGKLAPLKINSSAYTDVTPLNKEMAQAQAAYDRILTELDILMSQVMTNNVGSVQRFVQASHAVVDTILSNPDAFMWLLRVKKMDDGTYYYLLRAASWAILFGRHLGLAKNDLYALCLSLLLKDIGALNLPSSLVAKKHSWNVSMSPPDIAFTITENTVNLLKAIPEIHPKVIKIIKMHYERLNGSGGPQGLEGDNIFLLSKVSAIADFYDRVSYLKGAKCAVAISKAVSHLYAVRGIQFQDDLVVEFIKSIGLYPTGTLVKLTSHEVAVVVEQNYERRLKPKVMMIIDAQGKALDKSYIVDLYEDDKQKQSLIDSGKKSIKQVNKIDIVEDIEPYDYPIRVTKMRLEHIANNTKKSFFSLFKK